jgi:hypothetical protein
MNGLLHFDRALNPMLRGVGQSRRERLQSRHMVGARRFSARQRRIAT